MADRRALAQRWMGLDVPILVACWLLGYWSPWVPPGSGTAWLALAAWGATHGLDGLEISSKIVTVIVTCSAVLGAVLRLIYIAREEPRRAARQLGLVASCAPLCVLMPSGGAVFFVSALSVVAIMGWALRASTPGAQPLWQRLMHESFTVLAAACFLTMSWQYNAQWLIRGLLIAAGMALIARAALPVRRQVVL